MEIRRWMRFIATIDLIIIKVTTSFNNFEERIFASGHDHRCDSKKKQILHTACSLLRIAGKHLLDH